MDATCISIGSLENVEKIERVLELIYVITYRDLCRSISPPDRPHMRCYRTGCQSPSFAVKALMNLYNSVCVVMSNYIAKENDQNGCNMHIDRSPQELQKNRKEA